ncbi:hypothetical protein T11_721 [Trichinella zimbabwensis]|uniref:Uncharacterized protein n=1 Tax=Trichinella zimbabwensis TaxID=268475 RepID=A0A0V1G739_9BILA|nr:hypothetical protein T11_721 [Trichinella zimbabwensis]
MHDEAEPTTFHIFTKKLKCHFSHESRCLMHDEAEPTKEAEAASLSIFTKN